MKKIMIGSCVLMLVFAVVNFAGAVTVTPDDLQGWGPANQRSGGDWAINTNQPRSGNGSLELSLPDPTGLSPSPKIDFELLDLNGLGLLSDIDALSFDWYRDSSSTAAGHFTPALRLYVHDPTISNTHYALLIWEGIYNNYPAASGTVPTDTWVSENILGDNFWKYPFDSTSNYYDRNLDEWGFSPETIVYGINVGLGSGWNGSYLSYVDNITLGFEGNDSTTYNFETVSAPIPEPSTMLLLGSSLIGLIAWSRKKFSQE